MAKLTVQEFQNFFKYFKEEEHQVRAIRQLWACISDGLLSDQAEWVQTYRKQTTQSQPESEPAEPSTTSSQGIKLIQEFEGLRLKAYYCASGVLTIGWGHTGSDVRLGMRITEAEAERLLKEDLRRFEEAVLRLIDVELNQNEFDAIVSFAFNCGVGSLQHSTFCRRINRGEDKSTCFREEFIRWINGPNGPLPGLVRRREAEVELAIS